MYTTYDYSTTSSGEGFFIILVYLCLCILWIPFMAFWIWMIIDAAKREFESKESRLPWLLAIIFGGLIPTIVYFFKVKRQDKPVTRPAVVVETAPTETKAE